MQQKPQISQRAQTCSGGRLRGGGLTVIQSKQEVRTQPALGGPVGKAPSRPSVVEPQHKPRHRRGAGNHHHGRHPIAQNQQVQSSVENVQVPVIPPSSQVSFGSAVPRQLISPPSSISLSQEGSSTDSQIPSSVIARATTFIENRVRPAVQVVAGKARQVGSEVSSQMSNASNRIKGWKDSLANPKCLGTGKVNLGMGERIQVTPKLVEWYEKHFNGIRLAPGMVGTLSTHPHASISRMIYTYHAVDYLYRRGCRTIVDVGGSFSRMKQMVRQTKFRGLHAIVLSPLLDQDDTLRNTDVAATDNVQIMKSTLAQFNEMTIEYDGLLFVHSAYHIQPSEIATALAKSKRKVAVSVHHPFNRYPPNFEAKGLLSGELSFKKKDRRVHCEVSAKVYDHEDLTQLLSENHQYTEGWLTSACMYNNLENFTDIYVLGLSSVELARAPEDPPFERLEAKTYVLPEWLVQASSLFGPSPVLLRFFNKLDLVMEDIQVVYLPKPLVNEVRASCIGLTSDAPGVRLAITRIKAVAKRLDEELTPNMIRALVQAVITDSARNDIWLSFLLSYDQNSFDGLPANNEISWSRLFSKICFFAIVAIVCLVLYLNSTRLKEFFQNLYLKGADIFEAFRSPQVMHLGTEDQTNVPADVIVTHERRPKYKPLPVDPDAPKPVVYDPVANTEETPEDVGVKDGVYILGPVDANNVPSTFIRDQKATLSAVRRYQLETPRNQEKQFAKTANRFLDSCHTRRRVALLQDHLAADYEKWRKHLKTSSVEMLEKELCGIKGEMTDKRFEVKKEKAAALTPVDGVYESLEAVERGFMPISYLQHLKMGPQLYSLAKAEALLTQECIESSDVLLPVYWVSSLSPLELSRLITMLHNLGYTHYVSGDRKKFDGYQGPLSSQLDLRYYQMVFPNDEDVQEAVRDDMIGKVKSRQGVKFEKDRGKASGSSNTTVGNTLLNMALCSDFIEENHLMDKVVALVFGDDVLLCSKDKTHLSGAFIDHGERVGFPAKATEGGIYDVTFLSGRFIMADVRDKGKTETLYCFSSLPGKALGKLFATTSMRGKDTPKRMRKAMLTAGRLCFAADSLVMGWLKQLEKVWQGRGWLADFRKEDVSELPYFMRYVLELEGWDVTPDVEETAESYRIRYGKIVDEMPDYSGLPSPALCSDQLIDPAWVAVDNAL